MAHAFADACKDPIDHSFLAHSNPSGSVWSGGGNVVYLSSRRDHTEDGVPRGWQFIVTTGKGDKPAGHTISGGFLGNTKLRCAVNEGWTVSMFGVRTSNSHDKFVVDEATVATVVKMNEDLNNAK